MTLEELKNRVIFQVNADLDDLGDYEPALTGYVNRGYDLLLYALTDRRLGNAPFPVMAQEADVPKVPEWTHGALADYATWLVYRNGNPQKQSRGQAFLYSFNEVEAKCRELKSRMSVDEATGNITQTAEKPPQFFGVY